MKSTGAVNPADDDGNAPRERLEHDKSAGLAPCRGENERSRPFHGVVDSDRVQPSGASNAAAKPAQFAKQRAVADDRQGQARVARRGCEQPNTFFLRQAADE